MYIGSFDFGQMLNQPGLPQNQVFGQPVQGGDALGSFMQNLPRADLGVNNNSQIDFTQLGNETAQGTPSTAMQSLGAQLGGQLTAEFLQNLFKPQAMPDIQPMSPVIASAAPGLSNPYQGILGAPQPIMPIQTGLIGGQPMQPMNPMLGGM